MFRKDADFNVSDRIKVCFEGSDEAMKIVNDNREYLSDELLASFSDAPLDGAEYCGEIELDIGKVTVSMKRS